MLSPRLSQWRPTTRGSELLVRCAAAVLVAVLGTLSPAGGAIEWLTSCETNELGEESAESTELAMTTRPVCPIAESTICARAAADAPNHRGSDSRASKTGTASGHRLANNLLAPLRC
ncbi:MAG: hypothetical protein KDA63_05815 [Planctomycetales bacterium]|nr:hypothetical protein [Planctomycetales bacterium]